MYFNDLCPQSHFLCLRKKNSVSNFNQFHFSIQSRRTMSKYRRPLSSKYPQVYGKFRALDEKNEKMIEYRIQDLPEADFHLALDLLVSDYMPDETFSSCLDLPQKPASVQSFRDLWHGEMMSKISIACYTNDDSNVLVSVDVLSVYSRDYKPCFEVNFLSFNFI